MTPTTFEFYGKGYLTLSAEGKSITLSGENPKAEFSLREGAEIEAIHSEQEPKENEKLTLGKIALLIVLLPIVLIILLTAFVIAIFGGIDGLSPEKFFSENSPFITKKKLILNNAGGESVQIYVDNPVYNKKNFEYIVLPQIRASGAESAEESEYFYARSYTAFNYKASNYPAVICIGITSLALAALGILAVLHITPITENPFSFILGLLISLVLLSFPFLTVWAFIRTKRVFRQTENNILTLTKEKTEQTK